MVPMLHSPASQPHTFCMTMPARLFTAPTTASPVVVRPAGTRQRTIFRVSIMYRVEVTAFKSTTTAITNHADFDRPYTENWTMAITNTSAVSTFPESLSMNLLENRNRGISTTVLMDSTVPTMPVGSPRPERSTGE